MLDWHKKVVLVTGSTAGFGKHLAHAFASVGARVIVTSRRQSRAEATAEQIRAGGGEATSYSVDVTQRSQVADMFQWVRETEGQLDVLVNNVGQSTRGRAGETEPEDFRELLETNLISAVHCTTSALPLLGDSQGSLVNIGSLACKSVGRNLGAYPASKFALAAYNHQLRGELAADGIHVLLVCPGPIRRDDAGTRYDQQAEGMDANAARPGGGVRLSGISPERLARQVIRACEKRQPELVVPAHARWLFAIAQLWPSWGDWIVKRYVK